MSPPAKPSVQLVTAATPGAVAIVQVRGPAAIAIVQSLTGRDDWPTGRVRFVRLADIDEGVVVLLRDDWAQLMPHGGPRVVQRLLDRLIALGCAYDDAPSPRDTYPEARSDLEADMLDTLARAASPLAVDRLLAQPCLWREAVEADDAEQRFAEARAEAGQMQRLIEPASVVVVGQANVGKSTLTNRMLGRAASIVADLPGTTRDWVAALAELGDGPRGVCVRWMDTPGLRASDDAIEQSAIQLARQVIEAADVLIAMRDPTIDWPDDRALPRPPDVYVINKLDDAPDEAAASPDVGSSPDAPLPISAAHDRAIGALEHRVLHALRIDTAVPARLWAFSPTLRDLLDRADRDALRRYVTPIDG